MNETSQFILAVAALITALGGIVIGAYRLDRLRDEVNAEKRKTEEERKKNEQAQQALNEAYLALEKERRAEEMQAEINRRNIILLGESMSNVRADNAKLALAFNGLYNDFERVTGSKPPIDLQMLKTMQTLDFITGPLPHLEAK